MRSFFVVAAHLWFAASLIAAPADPIPLWPDGAPGARGSQPQDIPSVRVFSPTPDRRSGAAIVVCPGGGYGGLADHEGTDYALYLNQAGVTAFVLKYRLAPHGYRHPAMLQDANRAIRFVRAHAQDWGIDPHRVGIMGSSAGGHLASTAVTHFDAGDPNAADPVERQSSRPDLGILCYAVITMGEFTHEGSKRNLLGPDPSPELVRLLSNELQVTKETPPCFVWHTGEDPVVPVENSLQFAQALRKAGVLFDLHIYEKGPHGIGLRDKPPFANTHPWARDLVFWLKERGFVR